MSDEDDWRKRMAAGLNNQHKQPGNTAAAQPQLMMLDGSDAAALDLLVLSESVSGGWGGVATFEGAVGEGVLGVLHDVGERFQPGLAVSVGIRMVQSDGTELPMRSWPAVVARIAGTTGAYSVDGDDADVLLDHAGGSISGGGSWSAFTQVHLQDTVSYLGGRHVWGVIGGCSLAEVVGGLISLAANGGGTPTTSPRTTGLPPVHVSQSLRPSLDRIPYVVASGESLRVLLARLLGRLGVRMEMAADGDAINVVLKDRMPTFEPIPINLGEVASPTRGVVIDRTVLPQRVPRDTVLDNPSTGPTKRVHGAGAVGHMVTSAYTDLDEAEVRSEFDSDREILASAKARLVTAARELAPGRSVLFDTPLDDKAEWQATNVLHLCNGLRYVNLSHIVDGGEPWRPARAGAHGLRLLAAVVNDGASASGDVVERDRLGRIPVSLQVDCAEGADDGDPLLAVPASAILSVPVVDPVAGGVHGFVPQHRQGDRCLLAVNDPFDAEVVGFLYDDERGVRAGATGTGVVLDAQGDAWSGFLFRAKEKA